MAKQFYIKSYNSSGTFIKTITEFQLSRFSKKINGGLGEMVFTLPDEFDNFNPNDEVSLGNRLELYVTDDDSNDPVKLYNGFIEQQLPVIENNKEKVEIVCLGVVSRLAMDILKSGSQSTLYTDTTDGLVTTPNTPTAVEVATVMKDIIDFFRAANTAVTIEYGTDSGDTIEETGSDITYVFEALKYSDALEKCRQVAPAGWFWYLDAEGIISFRAPNSTPDHTFMVGKEISRIEVTRGLDSVKNIVLVWDGVTTYKQYKDDTSIALYGRRVLQITDHNLSDSATVDNLGNSALAENKDPRIRIVMDIIDNNENEFGYDIESIEAGDTVSIRGVNPDEDLFDEAMVIKEVIWSPTKATLILETRQVFDVEDFIRNLRKSVEVEQRLGIPESYT